MMTFDIFQHHALRTAATEEFKTDLAVRALGLIGESAEVTEQVKKFLGHGHTLDHDKVIDELGDVLWYVAAICDTLGVSMNEVARRNVEKLARRYPDGFETERSVNR